MEIKMEEIKVVLDWFANTNHTGFLLAQKRGYFAEAGLEVELYGDVHGAMQPVSYTHLDVYKRQAGGSARHGDGGRRWVRHLFGGRRCSRCMGVVSLRGFVLL